MKPVKSGLRTIHNGSNDVAKVQLNIPAGDTIAVSDYVAAQLPSAFKDGEAPDPPEDKDADADDKKPAKAKAAAKSAKS